MLSGVSAFLWQAALLLLGAYFLGAFIGCWLRRRYSPPPKVSMESGRTVKVAGAAAAAIGGAGARPSDRFGRALEGHDRADAPPVAKPPAPVTPRTAAATAGALGDAAARAASPIAATPAAQPTAPAPPTASAAVPIAPGPLRQASEARSERNTPSEAAPTSAASTPETPTAPAVPTPAPEPEVTAAPAPPEPIVTSEPEPRATPNTREEPQEQPSQFTLPMSAAAAAAAALAARQAAAAQQQPPAAEPVAVAPEATSPPLPSIKEQMEDATPTAPATELPASTGSSGQATVAAQIAPAPAPPASDGADDLTQIAGLTPDDAAVLREAGVTTFAAIAAWSADDVQQIKARMGGDRRIARENWIEQAKLLTLTGSTAYTRRIAAAVTPPPAALTPSNPAQAPRAAPPPVNQPAATAKAEPPAKPASETAAPEATIPEPPTTPTAEPAAPATEIENIPPVSAAAAATAIAAMAPSAAAAPPPAPNVAQRAAFGREHSRYADDLQEIDGINAEVEKLLHEQGITRFAQIADWTVDEQQRIDRLLGGMNRVHRENWVDQARRLGGIATAESEDEVPGLRLDMPADEIQLGDSTAGEGQVIGAHAVSPAQPPPANVDSGPTPDASPSQQPDSNVASIASQTEDARANVRNLRSVRSEALVGTHAVDSSGAVDDLKRIRGIGVLIEKRLRAMGYASYEQIGSWTQSDVDRVNQQLDFRGRIERENWIEQARILAAGGQTEFSRRHESDE